jgi:CRP/FNR family cyclic AMP-dependent transcriptional regulator
MMGGSMAPQTSTAPLLEIEPDLARALPAEELALARGLQVPVVLLEPGEVDIQSVLAETGSFSAMLLDGLLMQTVTLGRHAGLRPIGPGDLLTRTRTARTLLITAASCRAVQPSRLALLGPRLMRAVQRWPTLLPGLAERSAEQAERLLAQLMICQLPRVEDRLLSMMWLLAESWGQVTSGGTLLPWSLTHEALGGMVGARRSTVTLALHTLIEDGSLVRQDRGWLLLVPPPSGDGGPLRFESPQPLLATDSPWGERTATGDELPLALSELLAALPQLHERHREQLHDVERRLARSLKLRNRSSALKAQIASQRARWRGSTAPRPGGQARAPQSGQR